jgi:hypothetical protein
MSDQPNNSCCLSNNARDTAPLLLGDQGSR